MKDHPGAADGLTGIMLKASPVPRAKIAIRAKGAHLLSLGLPFAPDPTLVVELRSSNGGFWGASFTAPTSNDAERFKAKTDWDGLRDA